MKITEKQVFYLHLGFNMEDDTLLSSEVPVKKAAEDAASNAEVIAILYLL